MNNTGLGHCRLGTLHVALTAAGTVALKISSEAAAAKPAGYSAGALESCCCFCVHGALPMSMQTLNYGFRPCGVAHNSMEVAQHRSRHPHDVARKSQRSKSQPPEHNGFTQMLRA